MQEIILWILTIQILGLFTFPVCCLFFGKLPDKGYSASKVLAIAILGYAVWMVSLLNIWDYSRVQVLMLLTILILIELICIKLSILKIPWEWLKYNKKNLILIDLIFISSFLMCSFFIAQNPAIELTEQPMDFMILNSIMIIGNLPPEDLWLASYHVNYYYFGHLLVSLVGTLLTTSPSITYNLGLALICASSSVVLYGIAYNCLQLSQARYSRVLALIPPLLIMGAGNQLGLLELFRSINLYSQRLSGWISIENLSYVMNKPFTLFPVEYAWWWRSSRIINDSDNNGVVLDYTITEFPIFSFLIGDLHAHLLSVPYLLLIFYPIILLCYFYNPFKHNSKYEVGRIILICSFLVAISVLINPWNLPISLVVIGCALIYYLNRELDFKIQNVLKGAGLIIAIVILVCCLVLPFIWHYQTINSSIALNTTLNTRISHLMLVNGLWILGSIIIYSYSLLIIKPNLGTVNYREIVIPVILGLVPLLAWTLLISFNSAEPKSLNLIGSKLLLTLPLSFLIGISLFIVFNANKLLGKQHALVFTHVLFAAGYLMVTISELFYLVDVFNNRMNTVFKFYYQSWFFLGISVTFFLIFLLLQKPVRKVKKEQYYKRIAIFVMSCALIGPLYFSIAVGVTHDWKSVSELSIDGEDFLKINHPYEYEAIKWLRSQPSQTIAEYYGYDYSKHGRLSSFAAHQSILGWPGHQIQWRNPNNIITDRQLDIDQLYTTTDINSLNYLIDKYQIGMITVGPLEHATYGVNTEYMFSELLNIEFANEDYKVYSTQYYDPNK